MKAQVNGINGIILLPDNWNSSNYSLNNTNSSVANFDVNTISWSDWTNLLEANGAVLLPCAGLRDETHIENPIIIGYYWSATVYNDIYAYHLRFSEGSFFASDYTSRYHGHSVRLVRDAQ